MRPTVKNLYLVDKYISISWMISTLGRQAGVHLTGKGLQGLSCVAKWHPEGLPT